MASEKRLELQVKKVFLLMEGNSAHHQGFSSSNTKSELSESSRRWMETPERGRSHIDVDIYFSYL